MDKSHDSDDWGDGSMKNPIEFREWFKIIFRVWRTQLTASELLIVLFVFDRTAGWGKEWEIITSKQFLTGVTGRDGRAYASGLGITEPTLIKNRRNLLAKGVLRERKVKNRTAYALNYEWNPDNENAMLARPKRLQQASENGKNTKATLGKNTKATLAKYREKEMLRKSRVLPSEERPAASSTDPEECLEECLEQAASVSRAARQRKVTRWTTVSATPAWQDLCHKHPSESPHLSVTKTDGIILHSYGKRWIAADRARTVADFLEFLGWCVARWALLRDSQFAWMGASSPGVPSIRFLVKFSDKFEQAWVHREATERLAAMPLREREIERRVSRGIERAVAEAEVDERLGIARDRQRIEQAAAKLERHRLADAAREHEQKEVEERNAHWRKVRGEKPADPNGTFETWT